MQEQIKKLAKDFAENELKKRWDELDSKNPALLKDILKKSANIGVFSFLIDEQLGGGGFSLNDYNVFLKEIAKGCSALALIFVSHLMGITPLLLLKDAEKRNKFLSLITASEKEIKPLIFTLAIYEENFSKLVADNLQTIIKQKDNNYILSGNKINVLGGDIAGYFILIAKLENSDKFFLLIVPANSRGIEIKEEKQRMGLKICPINDVYFNNVEISPDNVLCDNLQLSELLNYYKYFDSSFSAIVIGMAEEVYDIALKYTTQRYQGGKIICEHDIIKIMLADMNWAIESAKKINFNSSDNFISSAYTVEAVEKVCIDAIQLLGGYGYMKDFKIEQILRDVKTLQSIINPISRKIEYAECEINKLK